MKPGIREDDILIDVWDACSRFDRPQDVFRTMLRRGMVAMVESGDMPKAVIDACGLDAIVDSIMDRRRRKAGRSRQDVQETYPQHPQAYPPQPPYGAYPVAPAYPPYPPQVYAPQPDPAQWGHGHDPRQARPQDHGYERPAPEPARPMSEPVRTPEAERRALEDKVPTEPPRTPEPPTPEKRAEPAPKPTTAPPAAKKRIIGELM